MESAVTAHFFLTNDDILNVLARFGQPHQCACETGDNYCGAPTPAGEIINGLDAELHPDMTCTLQRHHTGFHLAYHHSPYAAREGRAEHDRALPSFAWT